MELAEFQGTKKSINITPMKALHFFPRPILYYRSKLMKNLPCSGASKINTLYLSLCFKK